MDPGLSSSDAPIQPPFELSDICVPAVWQLPDRRCSSGTLSPGTDLPGQSHCPLQAPRKERQEPHEALLGKRKRKANRTVPWQRKGQSCESHAPNIPFTTGSRAGRRGQEPDSPGTYLRRLKVQPRVGLGLGVSLVLTPTPTDTWQVTSPPRVLSGPVCENRPRPPWSLGRQGWGGGGPSKSQHLLLCSPT